MIEFVFHPWNFLVTPVVVISCGSCGNPRCESNHWRLSGGWILWSIHIGW